MIFKNYYKILKVTKNATRDEIKKSYYKLAMLYHPDKNQGDKKLSEKFKEINEAYDVLEDEEKRRKYDALFGRRQQQQNSNYKYSYSNNYYETTKNPFYGQGSKYQTDDSLSDVWKDILKDLNKSQFSDFFKKFFDKKKNSSQKNIFKGKDIMGKITITLQEAYNGSTRILKVNNEKLRLTIKPGIEHDQILKIKEKGHQSTYTYGKPGDLFVRIVVKKHKFLKRRKNDLLAETNVDIYTILLGGKIRFDTLKGKMNVSVPKGTPYGQTLRLKGLGMPYYKDSSKIGDLLLKIKYTIPKDMNSKETNMLKELYRLNKNKK